MHLNNYVKTTIFGLVCLLSSITLVPTANAFPTVDIGAIVQKVKSSVEQVQQKVKMVTQCKAVTQINNAIGKAKSMAAMAQSKAEELKKQAEKVKKLKEEADKKIAKAKELKKKYEEKKAKLEEYQKKIKEQADKAKKAVNDAKSKVNEAKNKVNEVKDKVNTVQNMASSVQNKVSGAASAVSSKVSGVTGASSTTSGKTSSATTVSSSTGGKVSASTGTSALTTGTTTAVSKGGSISSGISPQSSGLKSEAITGVTKVDRTGGSAITSTGLSSAATSGTTGRVGFTQAGSSASATSSAVTTKDSPLSKTTSPLVKDDVMKVETPLSAKKLNTEVEKILPAEEELLPSAKTNKASSSLKTLSATTDKTVAKQTEALTPSQAKTVKTTSAPAPTQAKTTSTRSSSTSTKAMGSTSAPVQTQTRAMSSAPLSASTAVAAPAIADEAAPISAPEEITAEDEELLGAKERVEKIEEVANEEGSFAALRTLKQTMSEAIRKGDTKTLGAISEMDTSKIVNSNSKIYEPTTKKTVGRKAFTVSPSKTDEKKIDKEAPAPATGKSLLQKNSSLWMDDGEFARQNSIKLSYADTLRFATEASDCDYEYKMVVEANNQVTDMFIMPESLAKECCLKPDQLKNMSVISDCVEKISKKVIDEDESAKADIQAVIADIVFEQSMQGNTEAIEDKVISASYTEDVLANLYDSVKNVEDNNSGISNISIANVQLLYLMNRIRKIYTTSLITAGLAGLDSATKEILDPETDIGLTTDSDAQYDYKVTRTDSETAIDVPIMPENLARKCNYTLESDVSVMKNCYTTIFNEQYEQDKEASSRAFIDNIQYYEMINVLAKGFFQKVKSAEYEQGEMKKAKEEAQDASDAHKGKESMMNTEKGMLVILDDIIRGYASRIAYNGLTTLTKLMPVEKATAAK